jgi:hypothetical protein
LAFSLFGQSPRPHTASACDNLDECLSETVDQRFASALFSTNTLNQQGYDPVTKTSRSDDDEPSVFSGTDTEPVMSQIDDPGGGRMIDSWRESPHNLRNATGLERANLPSPAARFTDGQRIATSTDAKMARSRRLATACRRRLASAEVAICARTWPVT